MRVKFVHVIYMHGWCEADDGGNEADRAQPQLGARTARRE